MSDQPYAHQEEEEEKEESEENIKGGEGEEGEEEEERRGVGGSVHVSPTRVPARSWHVPPHVMVAEQRAAGTSYGGSAFSLCQGAGRTLKGRDLRQVRNAILKQTGFI